MQASKELDVEFLDPLLEPQKVISNDSGLLDPQELQSYKGKRRHETAKVRNEHFNRTR